MMNYFKHLDPKAFLLGLTLSFVGLSMAGWLATEKNIFIDFQRSYQNISAETQFFPTSRQMAALVNELFVGEKIAVVVTGSSVMRGAGQSHDHLWSKYLQAELGEDYTVLNLALNAGGPGGQGLYMAEYLLKNHKKVLLISDISIAGIGITQDNGPTYRYFFFDSSARGYSDEFEERMNEVRLRLKASDPERLKELQIKSYLNGLLNFDDLWATVGYRYFYTVWTPLTAAKPWTARRNFPDSEPNCSETTRYKNYFNEEMAIMRGFANAAPIPDEVNHVVSTTIPAHMKPNTMFVLNSYSPFYVDKLSSSERQRYLANIQRAESKYNSLGIRAVAIAPDYTPEDFCDRAHFSHTGGKKLAASLAPHIRLKAKELGYE